jgi:hypothetical protein
MEGEVPPPARPVPPGEAVPVGPGVDVSFPTDSSLVPFLGLETSAEPFDPKAPTKVTDDVLANARAITQPSERSRAFQLIGRAAVFSNQLVLAHNALEEAAESATIERTPLVHDQRLMSIISTTNLLTEAILREGKPGLAIIESPEDQEAPPVETQPAPDSSTPDALPSRRIEGETAVRFARLEWRRAAFLARQLINPTYRNEMIYRIVESQTQGAATIALEFGEPILSTSVPSSFDEAPRPRKPDSASPYPKLSDEILLDAAELSRTIERPIWRHRGLVRVTAGASDSEQYDRGFDVARSITDPEFRSQALLLIAESQCRHDQADKATQTYSEVAEAVGKIPQSGLRGVVAGFLVDSLVSMGRFQDARACIVLYPEESQRFVALAAIAESQGRRGAAQDARDWIAHEAPPEYQASLYRRVTKGYLEAIEQNRSREYLGRELELAPSR